MTVKTFRFVIFFFFSFSFILLVALISLFVCWVWTIRWHMNWKNFLAAKMNGMLNCRKFFVAWRNRVEKTVQKESKENLLKMLFNLFAFFGFWWRFWRWVWLFYWGVEIIGYFINSGRKDEQSLVSKIALKIIEMNE